MNKKYFFVTLLMSLYFAWFLSFPYFGKASKVVAESLAVDSSQLTMIFILFHAIGFLVGGLFLKQTNLWKRLILYSLPVMIGLNLMLLFLPAVLWIPVMALIGLVSSSFILGWSVVYSTFNTTVKIRLYAYGLFIAHLFVLMIAYMSSVLPPLVLLLVMMLPLAAALIYSILNISEIDDEVMTGKSLAFDYPAFLVVIFFVFTFFLHFACGLMFVAYEDSFTVMNSSPFALNYFSYIPYLLACFLIYYLSRTIKLRHLVFMAVSLFGLAFVYFAMFKNTLPGFYLNTAANEFAVVSLSVFYWVIQGNMSLQYKMPYRVFGFGLFTSLLGVFCGGAASSYLLSSTDFSRITVALYAITAIFITLMMIPWLLDKISGNLMGVMEKDSVPPPLDPLAELTTIYKEAGLTEREIEIAGKLYKGYTNRVIAKKLFITENTLKTHLQKIYRKFDVCSKSELISMLANRSFPTTTTQELPKE